MNRKQLFDLADALQIQMQVHDRVISGDRARLLRLDAGLVMELPFRIISGFGPHSGACLIIQVKGKLGLFACIEGDPADLCVGILNLDKLPEKGIKLLEARRPNTVTDARELVQPAAAAWFRRSGMRPWKEMPAREFKGF